MINYSIENNLLSLDKFVVHFRIKLMNHFSLLNDYIRLLICILVLYKALKGIRGVRLDNRKVLRAPGPRTKYFERVFLSLNKILN